MTEANDESCGPFEDLWFAIEEAIESADPVKRRNLAAAIDAFAKQCPEDFRWVTGAQAPRFLHDMFVYINQSCRIETRSTLRVVDTDE